MSTLTFIEEINAGAIPAYLNTGNAIYEAIIGQANFVPNVTIVQSSDYNCGALCNELEYARFIGVYRTGATVAADATGPDLETTINTFLNLPRRGSTEPDANYLERFNAIIAQQQVARRTTKTAIAQALSYLVPIDSIDVVEWFDSENCYFQVRIAGQANFTNALYYDVSYYDNSYYGGFGAGTPTPIFEEIVQRIKAAGVNFSIFYVSRNTLSTNIACIVGSKFVTLSIAVACRNTNSTSTTIAATVA